MNKDKLILAYSGGLDTSVAIPWLKENYNVEIITVSIDLGMVNLKTITDRALACGAIKAIGIDAKQEFTEEYISKSLVAGAIYQDKYPLATALGRPLIAKCLVDVANKENAVYIAHGCTGKGNDQVRIEVSIAALNSNLKIIAPIREWGMSRDMELEYAKTHSLPIETKPSNFSIDENLWGRAIESGILEDPWNIPPEGAFEWTKSIEETSEQSTEYEIYFEEGIPKTIDNKQMNLVEIIEFFNIRAGENGIGRIDHIEDRLVGIKSREVYECPAASVLHEALSSLESLSLSKNQLRFKRQVGIEYSELVYNGLWYSQHRENLEAYLQNTQRFVSGTVKVKFHKGNCIVIGRKSKYSLYDYQLATYDDSDSFDHKSAVGFIKIFSLPTTLQKKIQKNKDN